MEVHCQGQAITNATAAAQARKYEFLSGGSARPLAGLAEDLRLELEYTYLPMLISKWKNWRVTKLEHLDPVED